mmetsp:Transcript_24731/g.70571  ORF Transcript_24731/g.70571 Transcript_24731/m.70571 type:complete len:299 (-) Transcript_24731:2128-3024(-)
MVRVRRARSDLDGVSRLWRVDKHRLVCVVVPDAEDLGELLLGLFLQQAQHSDGQALLDLQRLDLDEATVVALHCLTREVAQRQSQQVHQLLRLEGSILVVATRVVPDYGSGLDLDHRPWGAPFEQLDDGLHLRHPFRGRLWAEGSELLPWAGSLQAEAVLRDEAERLVLAETRLEEILAAAAHDEDPQVLPRRQSGEELVVLLVEEWWQVTPRLLVVLFQEPAVEVEEDCLRARSRLEEEPSGEVRENADLLPAWVGVRGGLDKDLELRQQLGGPTLRIILHDGLAHAPCDLPPGLLV